MTHHATRTAHYTPLNTNTVHHTKTEMKTTPGQGNNRKWGKNMEVDRTSEQREETGNTMIRGGGCRDKGRRMGKRGGRRRERNNVGKG